MVVLAGSMVLAASLPAQTPSWYPLQVGNVWLYRAPVLNPSTASTAQFRSIWVHGTETIAGQEYFNVLDFGREELLRVDQSTGSVVRYDRASNSEKPWLSLDLAQGATFPTSMPCAMIGTIASRNASITTPAGSFSNAVEVNFQGSCADAGAGRQFYAPNVGLVRSEETSFAGPLNFDLFYYRVGSKTGGAPEVSFTVAINAPRYVVDSVLQARLTLRNSTRDPVQLHFPSGQSFDLKIYDEKKNLIYVWAKGKLFTMIIRDETLGPGEKTYALEAPLTGMAPGHYTTEAYLTTDPVLYMGQVSFEIIPKLIPQGDGKDRANVVKASGSRVSGR